MIFKKLQDFNSHHLSEMIADGICESKTLEFKSELNLNSSENKYEFLEDLIAFANAEGGIILFGIEEEAGIAQNIVGIHFDDIDHEIRRIDNIIRDSIQPRIFYDIKSIMIEDNKYVLAISVPPSSIKPHAIRIGKNFRFIGRNSMGKNPLDINEVRLLFNSSANTLDKLTNFRINRFNLVSNGQGPMELESDNNSFLMLHVIPLTALTTKNIFDIKRIKDYKDLFVGFSPGGSNFRNNFEGILSYYTFTSMNKARSYFQLFRTGIIEVVDTRIMDRGYDKKLIIPGGHLRREVNKIINHVFELYRLIEINPPIYIMMSFSNVQNHIVALDNYSGYWDKKNIGRSELFINEIVFDEYNNINENMNIAYDILWNSSGWEEAVE